MEVCVIQMYNALTALDAWSMSPDSFSAIVRNRKGRFFDENRNQENRQF
jgi:hypothetical protein